MKSRLIIIGLRMFLVANCICETAAWAQPTNPADAGTPSLAVDPRWGVYETSSHQWFAVGRSIDDPAKNFLYDNQTGRYWTLTATGDESCGGNCVVRVHFSTNKHRPSIAVSRSGASRVLARRSPWRAEDVEFAVNEVRLHGRIWLPDGAGPFPAVVLVGGSGPNLVDDFRVYPYTFLKHGFAVLTFDKRGAGQSSGERGRSEEAISPLADDLAGAVTFLSRRTNVSKSHIGVLGISHGAWVAVEAAARDSNISFVIPIVGGGVPLWRAQLFDLSNSIRAKGLRSSDVKMALSEMRTDYALAGAGQFDRIAARITAVKDAPWFSATPAAPLGSLPKEAIAGAIESIWRGELSYDPRPRLAIIRSPILAIAAGSDRHVPGRETIDAIRGAATSSRSVTTILLPHANHWQGSEVDYSPDIHFTGKLFDRVGDWLDRQKKEWKHSQ